ncbi:hypothetical protein V6N11_082461 [Hibiscus sabdariffa]|uniref:Uncharacterized protein n=1 Tax=Hibiscus sabdariffa TaxID=183260 RepID=A0ABR2PCN7_9ROSI
MEKLSVLQTCAVGWVKEATPNRVLAQEMDPSGLQGFELVWVATSMDVQVTVKDSVYTVVFQEAEFVRVPAVENQEEEFDSEMGDKSNEVSVGSPQFNVPSEQVRVVSPCWVTVDVFQNLELEGDRDSPVGLLECELGSLNATSLLVSNTCALSSPSAVVGVAGATLASVLGSVFDGLRMVKSVVADARSRTGRGRLVKNQVLIEAGSDIVNASLIDSDIQESKLEVVTREVVSRLLHSDSIQFLFFFRFGWFFLWYIGVVGRVVFCG